MTLSKKRDCNFLCYEIPTYTYQYYFVPPKEPERSKIARSKMMSSPFRLVNKLIKTKIGTENFLRITTSASLLTQQFHSYTRTCTLMQHFTPTLARGLLLYHT